MRLARDAVRAVQVLPEGPLCAQHLAAVQRLELLIRGGLSGEGGGPLGPATHHQAPKTSCVLARQQYGLPALGDENSSASSHLPPPYGATAAAAEAADSQPLGNRGTCCGGSRRRDGKAAEAWGPSAVAEAAASAEPGCHARDTVVRQLPTRTLWGGPLAMLLPPLLLQPQLLPAPPALVVAPLPAPPVASAVGAVRGMSAAGPSILQELQDCSTVQEVQDLVRRHGRRMRPLHHAEAVSRLGLLTFGFRSEGRAAARRLAAECTAAALATGTAPAGGGAGGGAGSRPGVGMDVLKVLVRGWGWVRKPPPELLARMLEALVPGSSAGVSARDADAQQLARGPAVRQGYGRLHTATLRDAAELVEPLAALDALTPPLVGVLVNIAVRRAGNEPPAAVAAAAVSYGRAGVADPRVAQAFLEAAVARRGGAAAAAAAGHVAEALGLCAKAGWYDPRVFAEAADELVARGIGGLAPRQTWAVLRAFAGARHEHPLLLSALATHAKAFDYERLQGPADAAANDLSGSAIRPGSGSWFESAAASAAMASDSEGVGGAEGRTEAMATKHGATANGLYGSSPARGGPRGRELILELTMLGGLVQGFITGQVYDRELYDRLAAGAAGLLREATAARLGESQPRKLAAALTALLEGFAGVGVYPAALLEAVRAQGPGWMRFVSADKLLSLARTLADLRYRDEAILDRLDAAAAVFLENAVTHTAVAATATATATATTAGAAVSRDADVTWLPEFLDSSCRRLSYPCPRTVAALAAPAAGWRDQGQGVAALRGLNKVERKARAASPAAAVEDNAKLRHTLSRLRLLLLLLAQQQNRSDGAATVGADAMMGPSWVCQLMGSLSCSGARLSEEEELDLAQALARSIERAAGASPAAGVVGGSAAAGDAVAAAAAEAEAAAEGTRDATHGSVSSRSPPRLTVSRALAVLDDAAACHLFRAIIASHDRWEASSNEGGRRQEAEAGEGEEGPGTERDAVEVDAVGGGGCGKGQAAAPVGGGGLEAALHRALSPALAAALLARAASAWHETGLGTAAPHLAAAAAAAPPPPLLVSGGSAAASGVTGAAAAAAASAVKRLRGGGAYTAHQPPLLADLLRSLGLPVFEQWVTSDGFFRVARGVVLPGGRKVSVEVLPDEAFAANSGGGAAASGGCGGGLSHPVLIGNAAFRARCLASRGWRLVALPAGEWAAAEVAGRAACMVLMRTHSRGL